MTIEEVFGNLASLETERLLLRKMTLDDAEDMFAYASDPEVARYTTWDAHRTIEDTRAFLRSVVEAYEAGQVANWGVVLKETGRLVGTCGFVWWLPDHARAEIAYALARPCWGQGLTTEAVREVLRFGFERMALNRIEARCDLDNVGSERVMQKVGMQFEGILREQVYAKGRYRTLKLYSILGREYRAPGA